MYFHQRKVNFTEVIIFHFLVEILAREIQDVDRRRLFTEYNNKQTVEKLLSDVNRNRSARLKKQEDMNDIDYVNQLERRVLITGLACCFLSGTIGYLLFVCYEYTNTQSSNLALTLTHKEFFSKSRRNFNVSIEFFSLLPKVYNVDIPDWGPCSVMALEVIRLAAVIVTVLHLLALAINHYIGIARPLHYAGILNFRLNVSILK